MQLISVERSLAKLGLALFGTGQVPGTPYRDTVWTLHDATDPNYGVSAVVRITHCAGTVYGSLELRTNNEQTVERFDTISDLVAAINCLLAPTIKPSVERTIQRANAYYAMALQGTGYAIEVMTGIEEVYEVLIAPTQERISCNDWQPIANAIYHGYLKVGN